MRLALLALLLSLAILPAAEWEKLSDCRLLPNEYNDGDSFHVSHGGKEYIFRLYFVDTPESEGSLPERVAEQAAHFGITPERSIEIGKYAKQVTAQLLSHPFTVLTKFQDARGRSNLPRYYAFVRTADKEDLAELLVSSGLARAFGTAASTPSTGADSLRSRFDSLQSEARRKKLGAWGNGPAIRRDAEPPPEPRSHMDRPESGRSQPAQPQPGVDDITTAEILADIDPMNRIPSAPAATIPKDDYSEIPGWKPKAKAPEQTPAKAESAKISLNNASRADLENLPGIGPELAARIVEARPFESVSDLKRVKGIGPAKFAAIAPLAVP